MDELYETARALVAEGRGILAADESSGTIEKRFDTIGVSSTEETRRAYRDAGVIAFLFGGGADGTTSERTDGGEFKHLAARYARARLRTQPSR